MKILIVDDEQHCRENLSVLIEKQFPEIKQIELANSTDSAYLILQNYKPDVLFLDIEMPEKDGFHLLNMIDTSNLSVIFVTAHDEYALRSIKCGPTGYLLKPIDVEELIFAVNQSISQLSSKINAQLSYKTAINELTKSLEEKKSFDKICLSHASKLQIVNLTDIVFLSSDSYYTTFHLTNNTKIVMAKTLKFYSQALGDEFIRVHRSYLVNIIHIDTLIYDEGIITLTNGERLKVSRRKSNAVSQRLKQIC